MIKNFISYCKNNKIVFPNVRIGKITVAILLATILIIPSIVIWFNHNALQSEIYKLIQQPTNTINSDE